MKKVKLIKSVTLFMIIAILLASCSPTINTGSEAEEPAVAEPAEVDVIEGEPEEELVVQEPDTQEELLPQELTFGLLLVGPFNDRGWSETHYAAGLLIEENIPGTKMLYIDKVNTADRPGTTSGQLAEDLLESGAELIIFTSDDMKDDAEAFALKHPDIPVVHVSGDSVWEEGLNYKDIPNMKNVMGKMEIGLSIAGCAAALTTQTGKLGHIGPLIAPITLRGVASAFLGARYCWTNYLGNNPDDLDYSVTWIGFWFNIPGFTSDPSQVADDFINMGYDVLLSGIDTTEGLVQAGQASAAGKQAWAVAYIDDKACIESPDVCLGAPTFQWYPSYSEIVYSVLDGTFESSWDWIGPDWNDINDIENSWIGFLKGGALSAENSEFLDQFISELSGGLNLWTGPINYQDGSLFLADGEAATDPQIWYLPTLIEGMEGQSVAD